MLLTNRKIGKFMSFYLYYAKSRFLETCTKNRLFVCLCKLILFQIQLAGLSDRLLLSLLNLLKRLLEFLLSSLYALSLEGLGVSLSDSL